MSSVANRKFTDMKQIEFQQSGSSEINAMLTQPLLENSSTYMCEVTDLQCTIGRELAFPSNQWLFSVLRRPIDPNSLYTANLNSQDLQDFVKSQETGSRPHEGIFGIWEHSNQHGIQWKYNHWINQAIGDPGFGQDQAIPENLLAQYDVHSAEYYSAMDLVYDVSQVVKTIDSQIKFEQNRELANNDPNKDNTKGDDFRNWDEEFYHIGMACDGGGRVVFKLSQYFRRNYMIVTSNIFQQATGYNLLIGEYSADQANTPIYTLADLQNKHDDSILDQDDLMTATNTGDDPRIAEVVYKYWQANNLFTLTIDTPQTSGPHISRENRDSIPIQDGIDVRKKVIVEVSLPISHTLAWSGQKESTRYVLQEFVFPSETVSLGFLNHPDFTKSGLRFKQRSLHGEMILLNGGTTLALKKLNEGQMQAFRVSLLLEYNDWDAANKKYVQKRKPLEMEQGGFFYMKLLFTKETI